MNNHFSPGKLKIHKIDGSALTCAEDFRKVAHLVGKKGDNLFVVSAIKGVTKILISCYQLAVARKTYHVLIRKLKLIHISIAKKLFKPPHISQFLDQINNDFIEIEKLLKKCTDENNHNNQLLKYYILNFGETWSAKILIFYLNQTQVTQYMDASQLLYVNNKSDGIKILWRKTKNSLYEFVRNKDCKQFVTTGFIARNNNSNRVNLGFISSDFSAVIFAIAFSAKYITIWKDINEIMAYDHKMNRNVCIEPEINLQKVCELSKGIHPHALQYAKKTGINISIKNFYKQSLPGILINMDEFVFKKQNNIFVEENYQITSVSPQNINDIYFHVNNNQAANYSRHTPLAFYKKLKILNIVIIGIGNIGLCLFKLIQSQKRNIICSYNISLNIVAIANSQKIFFSKDLSNENIQLDIKKLLQDNGENFSIEKIINPKLFNLIIPTVLIDCTASKEIVKYYHHFIKNGFDIVSSNKIANSDTFTNYSKLKNALLMHKKHFLYEASVGAGLPIISSLKNLIVSGDEVVSIEGVFSGTLSYIFNYVNQGKNFSQALLSAYKLGLTESDPRQDLTGLDTARKILILARELGCTIELESIPIQSLLPESLRSIPLENFWEKIKDFDEYFTNILYANCPLDHKPYYIAEYSSNELPTISVSIKYRPIHSYYSNLKFSDNIVIFHTKFYDQTPLIIQGPGAGKEVTAAAILSDIINLF